MKIKSTFNISFSNTFCLFCLDIFAISLFSFSFLLFVAFHFCSIHDMPVQKGRVKLCDGDYTIKKEIGNTVSLSTNSMFFMLSMSCSNGGYVGCAFT